MKAFHTIASAGIAALCAAALSTPAQAHSKTIYIGMNGGPMEKAGGTGHGQQRRNLGAAA